MKRWIGVLGYPLTHSLSKSFHEKILKEKQIDCEFRVMEWAPATFKEKIVSLKQDDSCIGFSITMPYKETIRFYCDELDTLSPPLSKKTGVVNALKNVDGKWFGFNTDGPGFLESLRKWQPAPPKSATVVFLGCGATAKTLSFVLAEQGYRDFVFINRTVEKAIAWGGKLKTYFNDVILRSAGGVLLPKTNLFIINTTPISTERELWKDLNIKKLSSPIWFFDVLYNPSPTWLFNEFKKRDFCTMNGLSMFESQARLSFKNWISDGDSSAFHASG